MFCKIVYKKLKEEFKDNVKYLYTSASKFITIRHGTRSHNFVTSALQLGMEPGVVIPPINIHHRSIHYGFDSGI